MQQSGQQSGQQQSTISSLDTWDDVRTYLLDKYSENIQEDGDDFVTVVVTWTDGRSQMVIVSSLNSQSGKPWVEIKSPVGDISTVDLPEALEDLFEKVCGGMVKAGDRYWIRHAMPIGNISVEEFDWPLNIVSMVADDFEDRYVGGDIQ